MNFNGRSKRFNSFDCSSGPDVLPGVCSLLDTREIRPENGEKIRRSNDKIFLFNCGGRQ